MREIVRGDEIIGERSSGEKNWRRMIGERDNRKESL
jgi:hypothetical protein